MCLCIPVYVNPCICPLVHPCISVSVHQCVCISVYLLCISEPVCPCISVFVYLSISVCFVMQMLYLCVLCASCCSSQCCVLHDLQFVNAGRGCKRRPYGRDILQRRSHNRLVGRHECILMFTQYCCSECFYDL